MAKTNIWLRGARGKLAGASIRKAPDGGTQIVPIVTPHNPKTRAQVYQRALLATVARAYSAGKKIFDHSFQNKEQGAMSMNMFMHANMSLFRSLLALDLEDGFDEYTDPSDTSFADSVRLRFTAPGFNVPVPNTYMVSDGTYDQTLFTATLNDQQDYEFRMPSNDERATVSQYAEWNNILPGDTYTFLAIVPDPNTVLYRADGAAPLNLSASLFNAWLAFCRLTVRQDLSPTEECISYQQLFTIKEYLNTRPLTIERPISLGFTVQDLALPIDPWTNDNVQFGGIACIRARENSPLRSRSFMMVSLGSGGRVGGAGLATNYVYKAWHDEEPVGQSSLILEGGDIS